MAALLLRKPVVVMEPNAIPGFTGTISYVDTFQGDDTIASKVVYAVDGNQVSRIQAMNMAKLLLLMVGPFNDD